MALTRKFLTGMGLTSEQVDAIIDAHTETVDGLKEQIQTYKADAEALPQVKADLKKAQDELANSKNDPYQVKYDSLKEEYDQYKKDVETRQTHAAKEEAYKALLKEIGINEKRIPAVMKVSDIDSITLDDSGKIKEASDLKDSLREEWSDFVVTTSAQGTQTPNPPSNTGGGKMSKDEIFGIKDPVARQNAIAENIDLFTSKEN